MARRLPTAVTLALADVTQERRPEAGSTPGHSIDGVDRAKSAEACLRLGHPTRIRYLPCTRLQPTMQLVLSKSGGLP